MAQYDVHRLANGHGLVIDCQSDLLDHIGSRFVVPLLPVKLAPPPITRLNPVFQVDGAGYVMLTQSAGAIRRRDLGPAVASLADRHVEIVDAIDVLLSGV